MSNPIVKITVEDYGTMTAELYPDKAPVTVENFIKLAKSGFYEGLIFHRVINGFMIQGGGFDKDFVNKETGAIKGEFRANGWAKNDIPHDPGVLSMARTSDPNSASSQIFIMHKKSPHLDGQYAAFGKVTEGLDIVNKIATVPTTYHGWYDDVPRIPVVIKSVEVVSE